MLLVRTKGTIYREFQVDTDDTEVATEMILDGMVVPKNEIIEDDQVVVESHILLDV